MNERKDGIGRPRWILDEELGMWGVDDVGRDVDDEDNVLAGFVTSPLVASPWLEVS